MMRETNLRSVDLNLLVLLGHLIEQRSVTRAATAANLSQPAMSRALGRLRALLRDPIVARGPDGPVLTPRALGLHADLKRILADIQALVAERSFDPAKWDGEVTLAATDHQTLTLLPDLIARLSREAPGLTLRVVPFVAAMLDELRSARVHLSFGIAEQALPPGLRFEPLYEDCFVTLLRRGHPAASDWTLERFVGLSHVLVTVLGDGRGAFDDLLAELGLTRRIALRLPHFYAAMAVVARSDLVVSLPRSLAGRFAAGFDLIALPPPLDRPPFTVTTIWPEALEADPGITWLRSVVREEARPPGAAAPI